jgi:hypothetical protein
VVIGGDSEERVKGERESVGARCLKPWHGSGAGVEGAQRGFHERPADVRVRLLWSPSPGGRTVIRLPHTIDGEFVRHARWIGGGAESL